MFGYRHAFHAGNFADVFKHVILVQLLRALQKKDKPFWVLDTHAGAGRYDLGSAEARKVGEYREGIARLWERSGLSPELRDYREQVAAFNPDGRLRCYPGSPRLIQRLLRAGDRLVACELHPNEFPVLQAEMAGERNVSIQKLDGYAALKAYLPPKEGRGLLFMDPSFEMDGEFERLKDALRLVQQRWRNGMTAIWYPILHRAPSARFHASVQQMGLPKVLCAELGLAPYDSPQGMHGCGLLIVNPPWQLDVTLQRVLPELLEILRTGPQAQTRVEWLAD
ncbi:MAG TPA: 23S rRNA (adenine(2030)-N(6))-methyltransferase RlmJ [Nevskiales bacterium]|nr:23S rRNA (adenine(2030)-N(6))-methyltransferase RlmJ [Nevskiales bacterium]